MKKSLILLSALMLTATGAGASPATESFDWKPVEADYEVPVPNELKQFASFKLNGMLVRMQNGVREYQYSLPLELTGRPVTIHLQAIDDQGHFKSDISEATCVQSDCSLRYPGLDIQDGDVLSFLKAKGVSGSELSARVEVARQFRIADPAGFIHFENYPETR